MNRTMFAFLLLTFAFLLASSGDAGVTTWGGAPTSAAMDGATVSVLAPVWTVLEDIRAHWDLIVWFVLAGAALYYLVRARIEGRAKMTIMDALEKHPKARERPVVGLTPLGKDLQANSAIEEVSVATKSIGGLMGRLVDRAVTKYAAKISNK